MQRWAMDRCIPKRLRIYFMFDRKLLSKLSQCVWPPAPLPGRRVDLRLGEKVLSVYLKHAVPDVHRARLGLTLIN